MPFAFDNCISLQSIRIPSQTKDISSKVWMNCVSLESVEVDPTNPYFAAKDGVLYCKDFITLLYYPPHKKDSTYTFPQSVQRLYTYAFRENQFLQRISLSRGIKKILPYTFSFCPLFRSVKFPDSLEQIAPNAFFNCPMLSEVNLPAKFQSIKRSIFVQCNQLK